MTIKLFTFNPVQVNTMFCTTKPVKQLIDAGCFNTQEKRLLQSYIDDNRLKLVRVLNTHYTLIISLAINFCSMPMD